MTKKCDYCGKDVDILIPYLCSKCGKTFCSKHRLPEKHECIGIQSGMKSWIANQRKFKKGISAVTPISEYDPIDYSTNKPKVFREKSEQKTSKDNKKNINDFSFYPYLKHLIKTIGFLSLLLISFNNFDTLDHQFFWILNLGGVLNIVLLILLLHSFFKLFLDLKRLIPTLANSKKIALTSIMFIICAVMISNNGLVISQLDNFNYEYFYPIQEDSLGINQKNYSNNNSSLIENEFIGTWRSGTSGILCTYLDDGTYIAPGGEYSWHLENDQLIIRKISSNAISVYNYQFNNYNTRLTLENLDLGTIVEYVRQ